LRLTAIILLVLATNLPAQSTFEAASIKAAQLDKSSLEGQRGVAFSPGSLTMRSATLRTIILTAYDVKDHQISGPSSLDSERYDIVARAAGPATDREMRPMLQALLADRFHLALHRETRDVPVFALVPGKKGPKLRESTGNGRSGTRLDGQSMVFDHFSIEQLTAFLTKMRAIARPVIDRTGLTSIYDFRIDLLDSRPDDPSEAKRAVEHAVSDPGFAALLVSQIGLKLESRNAPTEVLVIDHVERPSGN
jgi:uncharacterized protein (TIGR03435 family)